MCGIAGQLSFQKPPDADLVSRMTACLSHRGPDGAGVVTVGAASLGHRRLAVIDLSDAAAQPMRDPSGQYVIVFNGEIYNFWEIRQELCRLGAAFRTQSDTEVIVEAYKRWGVDALPRLNGMFALALWDNHRQELMLARDRLGKKPLFYRTSADGSVVFASELKALCQDPSFDRRLDPRALSHYLSLNYTLTSAAILQGVSKLAPGHYMICRQAGVASPQQYWNLAERFGRRPQCRSFDEAAEALRTLIDEAVRIRMISDVPLGVFLSGGLDSSALAASMCQAVDPRSVHSFSMGFAERSYSELAEARVTAEFLGIDHHDATTNADVAALLPAIVYHGDEPFADNSIIPTYLLSEFARRRVTVCLTGDGGDEVFAGYETYVADMLHRWTRRVPALPAITTTIARLLPVSLDRVSVDYKIKQFLSGQRLSTADAHYHWRTIFTHDQKRELLRPEVWQTTEPHDPASDFRRFDSEVASAHYLNRAAYVDLKTWLADDILVKADRASMAHGLELRAPLLDYRIVEFAASLPVSWKIRGTAKKRVLRRSQARRLPPSVLSRRKMGFNAPASHWLLSTFRREFESLTLDQDAAELFNTKYVRRLWDEHAAGHADHGYRLLGLIVLQLWLRRFKPSLN
jgi:asparagine synthase (glutamine-hydrolysing)